jgi:hypothetical protein
MKKPNKFLDKRDKITDIVCNFSVFGQENRSEHLGGVISN